MLNLLTKTAARKHKTQVLYDGLVSRAREQTFFAGFGVADSIDGRFDLLVLHVWMVLAELKGGDQAQCLINMVFAGFDEAMREQGVGDIGIGHKLKAMAKAFYGRIQAYETANNEEELAAALARNLWRGAKPDERARKLAVYAFGARNYLAESLPGTLDFGPLPTI